MSKDDPVDRDDVDHLYQEARQAVLEDPGYLMEMISALHKQREYRQISEDL